MYGTTGPTLTPIGHLGRYGHLQRQRVLGKALLRLRQSVLGYRLVAAAADSERTREFANRRAEERAVLHSELQNVVTESGHAVPRLRDVAGRVHRVWIRNLDRASDATLLLEVDRGESALEAAVIAAGRNGSRSTSRFEASHLAGVLEETLTLVRSARREAHDLAHAPTRRFERNGLDQLAPDEKLGRGV